MKIRTRLILYFLLLAFIPLTVINWFSFVKSESTIKAQAIGSARASIAQIGRNVDTYMLDLLSIAKMIVLDRSVAQWLNRADLPVPAQGTPSERSALLAERYRDERNAKYFLNAQKGSRPYVLGIYLLRREPDGKLELMLGTDSDLNLTALEEQDWWRKIVSAREIAFVPPHSVSYFGTFNNEQAINLLYPMPGRNGAAGGDWIFIRMSARVLDEEFATGIGFPGEKVGLTDEWGNIVFGQLDETPGDSRRLDISSASPVTGWTITGQIPSDQLFQSSRDVRKITYLVTLVASGVGLLLAFTLSNVVLKPLRLLRNAMRGTKTGSLQSRVPITAADEIGELSHTYNQMLDKIEELLRRVAEEESAKKDAELKALQYQINPHFLYNTLNSVQWLAKMHGVPQIKEIIAALIKLLEASLGKKGPFTSVAEEIDNLRHYVAIQQFRFGDGLHVEYDVDESALHLQIPRLVLQPLVENAIFHGLEDGRGNIWVEVRRRETMLYLSVADDGVGMSEDKLSALLEDETVYKERYSGIGLRHVKEKIARLCGPEYGIRFLSEPGQGTKATLILPVREV